MDDDERERQRVKNTNKNNANETEADANDNDKDSDNETNDENDQDDIKTIEEEAEPEEHEENNDSNVRRSTRVRTQTKNLSPVWKGKSYLQAVKGQQLNEGEMKRIETSHNLVTQAIDKGKINEYTKKTVKMIARSMDAI